MLDIRLIRCEYSRSLRARKYSAQLRLRRMSVSCLYKCKHRPKTPRTGGWGITADIHDANHSFLEMPWHRVLPQAFDMQSIWGQVFPLGSTSATKMDRMQECKVFYTAHVKLCSSDYSLGHSTDRCSSPGELSWCIEAMGPNPTWGEADIRSYILYRGPSCNDLAI